MSEALPSRRIGRYEVVRVLGEGGMGVVFLGRDPALGRMVAIKTVRLSAVPQAAREAVELRFQNEARAVAKLRHPAVVAVHDTGIDPEMGAYSVFEYVPGESLRDRMDGVGGPLPVREAVRVIHEVALALDAAHEQGIVHRDVKPANILLAKDGSVKLADFGVARVPDAQLTRDGAFLGTPSYAAPESLSGGEYSAATDTWGLAVVAYEMLVGRHPFPGETAAAVSALVLTAEVDEPRAVRPDLGPAASKTLLDALSKRPAARPQRAIDLARALEQALDQGETLPPRGQMRRGQPTLRRAVGSVALVVAVLGGLLAVSSGIEMSTLPSRPDAGAPSVDRRPSRPSERARGDAPGPRAEVVGAPTRAVPDVSVERPSSPRDEEEEVKALLERGRRCRRLGDEVCARAAFEAVLAIDPAHPEARRLLARP